MPELPEVETLRRGLERDIQGRRIRDIIVADTRVLKGQDEATLRQRTFDCHIQHVRRRGKYLLLPLLTQVPISPSVLLCIHLKMRGQLLLEEASAEAGKYHCVSILLDNGQALRYYDMWAWGELRALTDDEVARMTALSRMGPEPLEPNWQGQTLAAALAGRKTAIKPMLLDQEVVAGVGNIYADESLYRARILPTRPVATLTSEEFQRLADSVRTVLQEAVEGGGTTSDEYVDLAGQAGRYTPRVYNRGGKSCPGCGAVLERIRLGGRGTVFCPQCQS